MTTALRKSVAPAALVIAALSVMLHMPGCGQREQTDSQSTIVVYSPHGIELEKEVEAAFEAKYPGRDVKILDMGGGSILSKIRAERSQPRCDVWWGGAHTDTVRAEEEGLLAKYTPPWTKCVTDSARSMNGGWLGMYYAPHVIMYNKDKLKREDVPTTWDGLLDEKWKGKIVIRDVRPSATMKINFCTQIWRVQQRKGTVEDGFKWLNQLHANTGAYAANPAALYRLLTGDNDYALTIWNMMDALLQSKNNGLPFDFVVPRPSILPVDPIAMVKGCPNPEGAKLFIDFVNTQEQLLFHANKYHRMPVRHDIPRERWPDWMQKMAIVPLPVDWKTLQKNQDEWIARWHSEIKSQ
jgi:iron(III) transport system substrate-binding protein